MTDTVFAAEMAALAADRRARERGRIGDGMAAEGAKPGEPNGWMDFSGAKVPVRGSSGNGFYGWESKRHVHDADCLTPVAGGERWTRTGHVEVPEPGWSKCQANGALMAHQSGDRLACPEGVA